MQIDEGTYKRLPAHLQALFERLQNPSSDEVLALFPQSKGELHNKPASSIFGGTASGGQRTQSVTDSGSAARFFYCAKASRADRDEGLDDLPLLRRETRTETGAGTWEQKGPQPSRNPHPTVKPTDLMRYLCRLVTPPGGVVLDPFMGSGSTGKAAALEGFDFVGIEIDAEYLEIARLRTAIAQPTMELFG